MLALAKKQPNLHERNPVEYKYVGPASNHQSFDDVKLIHFRFLSAPSRKYQPGGGAAQRTLRTLGYE